MKKKVHRFRKFGDHHVDIRGTFGKLCHYLKHVCDVLGYYNFQKASQEHVNEEDKKYSSEVCPISDEIELVVYSLVF